MSRKCSLAGTTQRPGRGLRVFLETERNGFAYVQSRRTVCGGVVFCHVDDNALGD